VANSRKILGAQGRRATLALIVAIPKPEKP